MDYKANMSDIDAKFFTTSDYNKLTSEIVDKKLRQTNLAAVSDIHAVSELTNNNK